MEDVARLIEVTEYQEYREKLSPKSLLLTTSNMPSSVVQS